MGSRCARCVADHGDLKMIRKVERSGEELVLVLDEAELAALGAGEGAELEVCVEGDALVIRRATQTRAERLAAATDLLMTAHEETLRRLAL
jgi:antitoxin component of MazEF toxin-antitoxin module